MTACFSWKLLFPSKRPLELEWGGGRGPAAGLSSLHPELAVLSGWHANARARSGQEEGRGSEGLAEGISVAAKSPEPDSLGSNLTLQYGLAV